MPLKMICLYCNKEFSHTEYRGRKYCSQRCYRAHKIKSLSEKYEMYVIKNGDHRCWSWKGHTNSFGYGMGSYKNKGFRAHRASWIIHRGEIPDGLFVCHHCDNPICSNPRHLFLGNNKDNQADSKRKGRHRHTPSRGEKNGTAKLKGEEVLRIRELAKEGHRSSKLAKMFKISHRHLNKIKARKTWKHI